MKSSGQQERQHGLVVPALVVTVTASTAALLLLFAFVIWFAELIGSLTLALLITGVVLSAVAWSVYKVALHPTLRNLRAEYEQFMALVALIKGLYDCALQRITQLIQLLK